jgi:hypothetical protein
VAREKNRQARVLGSDRCVKAAEIVQELIELLYVGPPSLGATVSAVIVRMNHVPALGEPTAHMLVATAVFGEAVHEGENPIRAARQPAPSE